MSNEHTLHQLSDLVNEEDYLGAVYQMDYNEALIVTNDFRQMSVGGVAQNSFLTVASLDGEGAIEDVILLSVIGPQPLKLQRELHEVRETLAENQATSGALDPIDVKTESRLGVQALRCKILGTYYRDEAGKIRFGADIDNIRSAAFLKVYRPKGKALSLIASFTNSNISENEKLEIGKVRYTETRKIVDQEASAFINIKDIIGAKTFLVGLTRSGKSNSMKTILQKVHKFSRSVGEPVAQLVFDPQGEYASTNSQDGEAIANIGNSSEVSIYKMMDKTANEKEKFLQFNLFKTENLPLTYELIKAEIDAGVSGSANYIAPLLSIDFELLEEGALTQQKIHYARKKLGLFALIYESLGNKSVPPFGVNLGEELAAEIVASSGDSVTLSSYSANEVLITSTRAASKVVDRIIREYNTGDKARLTDSWKDEFKEGDAGRFFDQLIEIHEKGRNGVKAAISRIEELHSEDAEGDVRENVWNDIKDGKLIIVDLSKGSTKTSQALSELIVNYLLDQASDNFTSGRDAVPFQIAVEEAHNLFERDSSRGDRDPWVRISKEAAKYKIGLVYATQEVSSVDRRILSNTHNWFASQMISGKELAELGNYYHFADWLEHIKKIETKGFTRMKTASSPYIIPVQIELFQADVARASEKLGSAPASRDSKTKSAPVDEDFQF